MSSLASTILPLPPEPSTLTSAVDETMAHAVPDELPLELRIPLPLSSPCSEHGQEDTAPGLAAQTPLSAVDFRTEHTCHEAFVIPPLESTRAETLGTPGPYLPVPAPAPDSGISLSGLQSLVASRRVHEDRTQLLQTRLKDLRLRCSLERRLLNTLANAYRLMIRQFRSQNQPAFVRAYDTCEDLAKQIGALSRPVEENTPYEDDISISEERFRATWMDILPSVQQESLLGFLHRLRTDTEYMASCLCKLSSAELSALTFSYRSESPIDSVLPGSQPSKSQGRSIRLPKDPDGPSIAGIRGLLQDDPLFSILHGLFDESRGPESWEQCQRFEVLSTVCARIMVGGKRGSDNLVTTVLDDFFVLQPMSPQPKLEAYLLRVLQDGSSILDSPLDLFGKQPIEIRNANAAIASSNFFEKCSTEFFTLLADELPQIVPPSAIRFVQAILAKIEDPIMRNRAKTFIVPKWFFCSFVSNILMYPESYGIMMKHHIGDSARQGLLKELAVRLQKQVYEVISPWNRYSLVNSTTMSSIEKIFSFFEPAKLGATHWKNSQQNQMSPQATNVLLTLSPRNALSLIRALSPLSPPSPASTDLSSENASTTSSIAASSTLTSGSVGLGSAVPSSLAPSISGTSMTSTTILSEYALTGSECGQRQADDDIGDFNHKAGSAIRGPGDATSTTLLELCHSIATAVDSQSTLMANTNARNWAFFEVSGNGLRHSPSFVGCKELNLEKAPQDSRFPGTDSHETLYNELSDAVFKVLGDRPLGSDSSSYEEDHENDISTTLYSLLLSAMTVCKSRFDFRAAYYWWWNIQNFDELSSLEGSETAAANVMHHLANKETAVLERYTEVIGMLGKEVHYLEMLAVHQKQQLQAMYYLRGALRDKLWYISDVKHSRVYEDALNVTQALRVMADSKRASKRPSATMGWARQRLRMSDTHNKCSTQALEGLASPKEYGGLSKLADSQVEATTRWMTMNSIENFCKGEEIIHRFCNEIQKCACKLAGPNMLDSPVLWSSDLFKHEKALFNTRRTNSFPAPGFKSTSDSSRVASSVDPPTFNAAPSSSSDLLALRNRTVNTPKSINGFWQATKPSSHFMEGIPYFKQPQHNLAKNPVSLLTPTVNDSGQYSKFSSNHEGLPSRSIREVDKAHQAFANHIKAVVTALLLSDLGHVSWNTGSETDLWIEDNNLRDNSSKSQPITDAPRIDEPLSVASNSALSDALSDSTITINHYEKPGDHTATQSPHGQEQPPDAKKKAPPRASPFPFSDAFERILTQFSSTADPLVKLDMLDELQSLASSSIHSANRTRSPKDRNGASLHGEFTTNSVLRSQGLNIPRTKATSLEEVMANCSERRAGTIRFTSANTSPRRGLEQTFDPPDTDAVVNALLEIFRNDNLRPRTLYRDLQFIATFVPSSILDQSAKGKAFWDVGLAALAYKEERCETLIHRANQITNYHVSANKDTSSFMNAYSPDLVDSTLGDAAQLWVTIAKEGSPIACRELGLFYLTHPELLPRITLPFSKSKDVFKSVTSSDRTSIETGGLDPHTFAVVFHWMELAANGGDRDARDFIRGNGELSAARS